MIGQRRAFGLRVDSQRNVVNALGEKKQPLNDKNITTRPVHAIAQEKKLIVNPVVKRKAYGGQHCMVSEKLAEEIDNYLKLVEKKNQLVAGFLTGAQIDGRMRGILLDWIIQIQKKFELSPETFYLACFILDRVVVPMGATRHNFQLIGLACIFVASKFEEINIPNAHDFVYMGGDFASIENLFEQERTILKTLKFQLSFTYPNHFLRKMRLLMPSAEHSAVYEVSKMLVDITMLEYNFASWLPSEMAATSMHLAYKIIRMPCPTELIMSVSVSQLKIAEKSKELESRLASHLDPNGKLKGVRLKYADTKVLKCVDEYVATLKNLKN